jgi:hypothetical protein
MMLKNFSVSSVPQRWLAFELSVLRRLKFRSCAIPFAGEPVAGVYLKRWGARVAVNDQAQWAWTKNLARVENSEERLTESDLENLLEDVYVPRHRLYNPALRKWFSETDAWWFDNLRANAERFDSPMKLALALDLGMSVGDYARSFDDETGEMRRPLSRVFRRLWERDTAPFDNGKSNASTNLEDRTFIAEERAELLFLHLPRPSRGNGNYHAALPIQWREDWVRGEDFSNQTTQIVSVGRLGSYVATKGQYLNSVEEFLSTALHIPQWAICYTEENFISIQEIVETVRRIREVKTVYAKDFSELTGARAAIIIA